jgi:hypothetical protein
MDFKTKLSGNNVSLFNFSKRNFDYVSDLTIHWEFYTEMREWGVKDVGVYAISCVGEIEITYWNEDDSEETETLIINSDDDGWVLNLELDSYELGHCICPSDMDIDYKSKIITVNF